MKIINKINNNITGQKDLTHKFIFKTHEDLNMNCNVLVDNFYLDTHNYFPITQEYYTFSEIFSWGDALKYHNFYSENFAINFEKNLNNFKSLSDIYLLGTSSVDNYYRNLITFLPRIFFIKEKLKVAIHRNSSNRMRDFIIFLANKMKIKIQFVFLDDGFYNFSNSQMPQFLSKNNSINILNSLKINLPSKKEKIYITRHNTSCRNLINESDIIERLKNQNFKIVDLNNMNIIDQIKLFSNSEIVVSCSGSGLANIVFCNIGTKIYEISPKYQFDYEIDFKNRYSYISQVLGLHYERIEADSIEIDKPEKNIKNYIAPKILQESNYYKNLLLKIEKINGLFD